MVISTIISAICGQKPSKKEILSVVLAFVGILALVFVQ
jgi:drug/metabolite transporter (DMT)-like permease